MENINISDLEYMCKYDTDYMDSESKNICEKYLIDEIVTDELLKVYVESQIEVWGDMCDGIIEFKYDNKIIKGKYNHGDYPAEILGIYDV